MDPSDARSQLLSYLESYATISPTFLPGYDTVTVRTGPDTDVCQIWPCGHGVMGISMRLDPHSFASEHPPTQRRASVSRQSMRSNYSQYSGLSAPSKSPVTAPAYRSAVHRHQSQQRSTGDGHQRLAPLDGQEDINVSRWNRPLIKSLAQLSSHLPSPSTQADAPEPIIVNSETPLRPSVNAPATWDYSQILNKDLARSRSSRSAVSAIIPVKGPLAAPTESAQIIAKSRVSNGFDPDFLGRSTRSECFSPSGNIFKTRSTRTGFRDLFRNALRSVQGKSIGLRSRLDDACRRLRGVGCINTREQEEAYNYAAEESLMKKPLLAFMDEEQWEKPESEVPVLTLTEDKEHWGETTRSAIITAQEKVQL